MRRSWAGRSPATLHILGAAALSEPVVTGILLQGVSGDWSDTPRPTALSHQQDSQPGPSRGHEAFLPQGFQMCQLLGDSQAWSFPRNSLRSLAGLGLSTFR